MTTNPLATATARHTAKWRKSSRSQNNGASCIEVAHVNATIAIRDSKLNTTGDYPVLTIPTADWNAMLEMITS